MHSFAFAVVASLGLALPGGEDGTTAPKRLSITSKRVTFEGTKRMTSAATIADRDQDGVDDFIAFSSIDLCLNLVSGASGVVRTSLVIGKLGSEEYSGAEIAGLADFDGDGVRDILVCGERWIRDGTWPAKTGLVWTVVDGAHLTVNAPLSDAVPSVLNQPLTYLQSCAVIALPDGGVRVVLFVGVQEKKHEQSRTQIWSFDPKTNALQQHTFDPALDDRFGQTVVVAGDIDRDGVPDLAIGGETGPSNVQTADAGFVTLLSGKTLERLRTISPRSDKLGSLHFGVSIAGGSDVDGDEVPDLVMGDIWPEHDAWCFSGATAKLIRPLVNPTSSPSPCAYECKLQMIPDCDGDKVAEIAVAHPDAKFEKQLYAGRVCIHSGATGALLAEFGADSAERAELLGRDWCVGVAGTGDYRAFLLCDGEVPMWVGIK